MEMNQSRFQTLRQILENGIQPESLQPPQKPIATNWHVITGAPGSGKTTIVKILEEEGYKTIPEMSREVIEQTLSAGFSIDEIMYSPNLLSTSILFRGFMRMSKLEPSDPLILDTSLIDGGAFYELTNVSYHDKHGFLNAYRYKEVLFLEILPQETLLEDKARPQDERTRQRIGMNLRKVYTYFGYKLTLIPPLPIMARVKMVKHYINK